MPPCLLAGRADSRRRRHKEKKARSRALYEVLFVEESPVRSGLKVQAFRLAGLIPGLKIAGNSCNNPRKEMNASENTTAKKLADHRRCAASQWRHSSRRCVPFDADAARQLLTKIPGNFSATPGSAANRCAHTSRATLAEARRAGPTKRVVGASLNELRARTSDQDRRASRFRRRLPRSLLRPTVKAHRSRWIFRPVGSSATLVPPGLSEEKSKRHFCFRRLLRRGRTRD